MTAICKFKEKHIPGSWYTPGCGHILHKCPSVYTNRKLEQNTGSMSFCGLKKINK